MAAQLEPVVRPAVEGVGFELEDLDVQQAGRRRLVKVIIDVTDADAASDAGPDGVGLDDIAEVSRAVSKALDADDALLAGAYTLEVTSPGVDRPLSKPRHWRRARLRLVKIKLTDGTTFTGRVGDADTAPDGVVQVLRDAAVRKFAYADVERAVVEVEFREAPAAEIEKLGGNKDVKKEES
ncbi:MAG: ribosome maturation factor RimP [Pseudonocardiaceae bacterium]|nr:ribosome maturation factor RimP [Pseudonocardiaceae bacterium]